MQVCDTAPLSDLDEESSPSAGVELGWYVVPTGVGQSSCDVPRAVEIGDSSLQVQNRLGAQVRHSRRADVLDRCDEPASEGGLQEQALLLSTLLPRKVRRAHLYLLGRPCGPVRHPYIVPVVDPLARIQPTRGVGGLSPLVGSVWEARRQAPDLRRCGGGRGFSGLVTDDRPRADGPRALSAPLPI